MHCHDLNRKATQKEGVCVYACLIHSAAQEKLTQHCEAAVLLVSCTVVSDPLWPHGLQYARPHLSLTFSRSLPKFMFIASVMAPGHLILWCPVFLLPSLFPSIRDFPRSHLFASDDQNTRASASASVLPVNIQGWSPLRLTGLISLLSKGLSGVFSSTTVRRHQFFGVLP